VSSQGFEGVDGEGPGGRSAAESFGRPDDEVAGYAAEVRAQFADLSEAEVAELLEDLEDHLREVEAEDAGTLRERLGAPAEYARELRQAAGLPEPGEGSGSGASRAGARPRRTLRSRVRQTMADAEHRAREYRAGREVLDFLPSLRPAWWVLRAWVAVRLLEVMTTDADPWHNFALIPQVGNSTFVGFLALLVAVPVSVYSTRRTVPDGWRRRTMGAGEGILVLFTVGMALTAIGNQRDDGATASGVSYVQQSQSGLIDNGKPISNLYVYDQSGKQLGNVFVYDQDGEPVTTSTFGGPFVDSDEWLDGNGSAVLNLFPVQLLQSQWSDANGGEHFVTVPPPAVTVPQGVHRASSPASSTASSTPGASPATPVTGPSTSASGGVTGAQPTSALPSSPVPGNTAG
jgi:hypothetical protein